MTKKNNNQILTLTVAFLFVAFIFMAPQLFTPQGEITEVAAQEFSIEEKIEQNLREKKIAELEAAKKEQENLTLKSQKREGEINQMINELNNGCEHVDKPELCITNKVEAETLPKAPAVK